MSYQAQADLAADSDFIGRCQAAAFQQANIYKDDQRPNWQDLAHDVLKASAGPLSAFVRLDAAGPGIADKVDNGDGTIDQAKVTDEDLLALTQANWPTVVDLFFPLPDVIAPAK